MNTQTLRLVGFLEGISFLFLLGIAMPMKYLFNNPILVPYAGLAHGFLFLAFLVVLLAVCHKKSWSIMWFLVGLLAAVLPFGTFVFDWRVKKMEAQQEAQ
ncbi:MAG: DUF3817 domain-containing protein [Alysiella sp.]|uniref:DUF3817 domain-containing protein n=1 Tax=Alysiella sp. TaxID=1872483 RepID=UPI0026DC8229|nr:DUF3817 domain-containing protein [Alysiella sp.]MDO4434073.1 DUF3817 domain-containing protein [Alysiella sp.]